MQDELDRGKRFIMMMMPWVNVSVNILPQKTVTAIIVIS